MKVRTDVTDVDMSLPSSPTKARPSKPSRIVCTWRAVLTSLRESREREAARLIHQHLDLVQDGNAIEFLPAMTINMRVLSRHRPSARNVLEVFFVAAGLAGLLLISEFACYRLSYVMSDVASSLALLTVIGR